MVARVGRAAAVVEEGSVTAMVTGVEEAVVVAMTARTLALMRTPRGREKNPVAMVIMTEVAAKVVMTEVVTLGVMTEVVLTEVA